MTKKRRRVYEPRVFDGRIIMSDEIGRIKGFLEFERIEAVSDSMRELIEDLWPELVHKLPPKKPQADKMQAKAENTATILGECNHAQENRGRGGAQKVSWAYR